MARTMKLRITRQAIDTYRTCVRMGATAAEAEQHITEAMLAALQLEKLQHWSTTQKGEILRLRCPAQGKGVRLRLAVIVRGDELHVVETLPPHEGWDPDRS
jgi:hypothetical protein